MAAAAAAKRNQPPKQKETESTSLPRKPEVGGATSPFHRVWGCNSDDRFLFILPWLKHTLIGTTMTIHIFTSVIL
jgi:hypothetical protein